MAKNKSKPKAKKKALTKTEIYTHLAEKTELTKKKIAEVFDALGELIKSQVSSSGPGQIVLPTSLIKVKRAVRPATQAREGRNPATGEKIMIAAKPERTVIKAMALKNLKQMV